MAVVQYTGIVNQLRGKLNGSVFNKSRNAFTLQKKQQQTKGSKGSQFEIRNVFSSIQRSWKTATATEKADWQLAAENNPSLDRFGNQTILSGYNQYIKANIVRWYAVDIIANEVLPEAAPAVTVSGFVLSSVSFTRNTDGTVTCEFEYNFLTDDSGNRFIFNADVSLPLGAGITTYYGRYVWIDGGQTALSNDRNGSVVLSGKYPIPMSGQRVELRLRLYYIGNGAQVFEGVQTIVYG